MTANQFRRIALGLKNTVEGAHLGHPDFRVGGRIFATLHDDDLHGMVKVAPDLQERLVREFPAAFVPENGAWGRAGCTRVRLREAGEDMLGEAMTVAWQRAVAEGPTKSGKKSPARPAKTKRSPIRR